MRQWARFAVAAVAAVSFTLAPVVAGAAAVPASAQAPAIPAAATKFVGDWDLAMQGPNGPTAFVLGLKIDAGKLVGQLQSDALPAQTITNITMDKESLVLSYTFDYQGNGVDAVVYLTPDKDGKIAAQIDFAGGAYVLNGAATKKAAAAAAPAAK